MTIMMKSLLVLAFAVPSLAVAQSTATPAPAQPDPGMSQQQGQSTQPAQADPTQPTQAQPEATQPTPAPMPSDQANGSTATSAATEEQGQTMSGTISADGKTFTSNNTTYKVSNPNSVRPFANQTVTVGYEMDTNNSIHISKVMLKQPSQ